MRGFFALFIACILALLGTIALPSSTAIAHGRGGFGGGWHGGGGHLVGPHFGGGVHFGGFVPRMVVPAPAYYAPPYYNGSYYNGSYYNGSVGPYGYAAPFPQYYAPPRMVVPPPVYYHQPQPVAAPTPSGPTGAYTRTEDKLECVTAVVDGKKREMCHKCHIRSFQNGWEQKYCTPWQASPPTKEEYSPSG